MLRAQRSELDRNFTAKSESIPTVKEHERSRFTLSFCPYAGVVVMAPCTALRGRCTRGPRFGNRHRVQRRASGHQRRNFRWVARVGRGHHSEGRTAPLPTLTLARVAVFDSRAGVQRSYLAANLVHSAASEATTERVSLRSRPGMDSAPVKLRHQQSSFEVQFNARNSDGRSLPFHRCFAVFRARVAISRSRLCGHPPNLGAVCPPRQEPALASR